MNKDNTNTKDKLTEEKLEQVSGGASRFKDIPRVPEGPVKEAYDNNRMSGMSSDYFEPAANITRGMFAYAIYRREGMPETGQYM